MTPRARRLNSVLVGRVFKEGRVITDHHLLLRWLRAAEPDSPSRLAFVVPSRVAPSSVERHRVRRRALAALAPLIPRLAPGFLVAGWAREAGTALSVEGWRTVWLNHLMRARLITNPTLV